VKVLVLDIGTSSVRASVFGDDVKVAFERIESFDAFAGPPS